MFLLKVFIIYSHKMFIFAKYYQNLQLENEILCYLCEDGKIVKDVNGVLDYKDGRNYTLVRCHMLNLFQ